MAVCILTKKPKRLSRKIKKAIKDQKIATWALDESGYLIHDTESEQWIEQAAFKMIPQTDKKRLLFILKKKQKNKKIKKSVYSTLQGHLTAMLISHFRDEFDYVIASSKPSPNKRIKIPWKLVSLLFFQE